MNSPLYYRQPRGSRPIGEIPPPTQATGLRRYFFIAVGWVCVGMATLGTVLPGLPTTPWVLAAAYCFDRSSERFARWLRATPVFGKLIADWDRHRGIRRSVKVLAVSMVVVVVTLSITLSSLPVAAKVAIGILAGVGIITIVFVVPTIREE